MNTSRKNNAAVNILRIARKTLTEYLREPQLFLLILSGPALLILLWYMIFLPAKDRLSDYLKIQVVNQDSGPEGGLLVETLRTLVFEGNPALDVRMIRDETEGRASLQEGKAALLLIIPAGFSQALSDAREGRTGGPEPEIEYVGDTAGFNYVFAKGFIDPVVRGYIQMQSGLGTPVYGEYEFLPGTGTNADFDAAVPGLLVFSLLFLIISSASSLVQEEMHHTLTRFRLARVTGLEMVAGVGLAQMVLAVLEVATGFGLAVALGYGRGTEILQPVRISLLLGVSVFFAIPVVGMGMITAAFSRNDGDAASLGSLFLVPLVFLSGILFPMPDVPLLSIGSRIVNVYDLFPSTLASEAIRKVVTFGDLPSLAFPMAGLLVQTAILVWIGSVVYQKRKLRT